MLSSEVLLQVGAQRAWPCCLDDLELVAGLPRATFVLGPLCIIMAPVVGPNMATTGVAAAWDNSSMHVRLVISNLLEHSLGHCDPGWISGVASLGMHPEEDLGPHACSGDLSAPLSSAGVRITCLLLASSAISPWLV